MLTTHNVLFLIWLLVMTENNVHNLAHWNLHLSNWRVVWSLLLFFAGILLLLFFPIAR